ncbi:MAG TPA: hypothetical protein VNN79_15385 [Actinomycetota bacterium]|nr:hypothetical protein [Actinomycetota bacterium]
MTTPMFMQPPTPLMENLGNDVDRPRTLDSLFEDIDNRPAPEGNSDNSDDAPDTASQYDANGVRYPDVTAAIPGGGPLLEWAAPKVFKAIEKGVDGQKRLARNREEQWKHWKRVRRGVPFAELAKSEDQSVYQAVVPSGVHDRAAPIPNKVDDLCEKQVSQILVDPPIPQCQADGDGTDDREAGALDLGSKLLRSEGGNAGTNDQELFRELLTMNRTSASSFTMQWIDPMGGGWRPMRIKAHPFAQDANNPLVGPVFGQDGQPVMDPATGQPMLERTTDPVLRYVGETEAPPPAGAPPELADKLKGRQTLQFVDSPSQAKREWLPRRKVNVLLPTQLRTFPRTATVAQAQSLTVLMWEPLGDARKRFPEVLNQLNNSQLRQLLRWRPKRWKALVPEAMHPRGDIADDGGDPTDDSLLFWYHHFCKVSDDYQDGAEVAISGATVSNYGDTVGDNGGGFILRRDTLREDVTDENGDEVPVLRDPPVSQFRAIIDTDRGDPFGVAPISKFGPANEYRAHLYLLILEDIETRIHINTYIAGDSEVTKDDMTRRDGTPINVLTKDSLPVFEQRPNMPGYVERTLDRIEHDMDTEANLNQTAQALDSSYSDSGEAKKVAISQARVQLAQDWQGAMSGCTHYWKIALQLYQAYYKVPQLMRMTGTAAAYKSRWFVGADLLTISTAVLAPGSGTMMSPAEKAQYMGQLQAAKWVRPEQAADVVRASMQDDLGLQPDPHQENIDRQIADWVEGPPKDWMQHFADVQQFPALQNAYGQKIQQFAAVMQQRGMPPQQAQQAAQQLAGEPPQQPPPVYTPFDPRANDEEPAVAQIRYATLSKFLASPEYKRQPIQWRQLVDQEYGRMATAAGIQTVRQQQEAQQAQQQAAASAQVPNEWNEFIQGATKMVTSTAQKLLGREVAAIAQQLETPEKPLPTPVPAVNDAATDPGQAADQAHESNEAALDRLHQSNESALDRAHEVKVATLKGAGTKLAAADRAAARAAGKPTPPTNAGEQLPDTEGP